MRPAKSIVANGELILAGFEISRFSESIDQSLAKLPVPTYAIDDETALKVVDGAVEVVSEGLWKRFAHQAVLTVLGPTTSFRP